MVSYYTARNSREAAAAAHQQITRRWWELALPRLQPYISQVVIDEISRGDPTAVRRRLAATGEWRVLEIPVGALSLANRYYEALTIPEKARNDALHLAVATLGGMDYLVSWNCTHIAAARVRSTIESLNAETGLATPVICTPEELMEVGT